MTAKTEPRTDQGRWLIDHQGLVNIGKIDGSMRGDEIDLRASVVTIEDESWNAALLEVEGAIGPKRRPESGMIRAQLISNDGWNDCRDKVLRAIASLRKPVTP